ncbi:MAG TPA: type I-C CRISPR-associated protein Cas7/Csd2 [Bacillota bacterium]|nr:type I-C CRISPR-associated protein Cas7/Csd2 [Bacillota bacterium]HOK69362.1 type I-C CRISPR-associated protein Cas7/Csd2 [Bacillota bacterium]HPP85224.1 type I-C CRISPR-associated protein Cas7/Csd2 [Bacillota bacterium]
MSEVINNRYEFSLFFEVENGNPNGDPDAGNMPRRDAETGIGIITDVCLKRKIRNYVDIVKQDAVGYKIYVRNGVPLDTNRKWAYEQCDVPAPEKNGKVTVDEPDDKEDYKKLTRFMCQNFYDIRAFGAVMTLAYNCGQVRGPVQLGFAKSIDVINPQEIGITSCTYANEGEKSSKMGRKNIVPYALYRVDGFISPSLAQKETGGTGFSTEDLELLWQALINMFDFDHSAARGKMASRALYVFKHDSVYGNCPAYRLFEAITAVKKEGVTAPRSFQDYNIAVDESAIPQGVTLQKLL